MSPKILVILLWVVTTPIWAAPHIEHWLTANGARVYFIPAEELPMVDVRVVFDAGAARDENKLGLAQLSSALLPEGAGNLSADAIADRFDSLGAQFGTDSARDMAVVSLRSLTKPEVLLPALETTALILAKPTMPEEAFERVRKQMESALQQQQQSPSSLASRAFYHLLYGDYPYAHLPLGTLEGLARLTRDDALAFHQRYYVASNAVVAIVGALDRGQAEELAEKVIGGLPAGESASALSPVPEIKNSEKQAITYPSTQTTIILGTLGIRRADPDYFPLYVGNHILGGNGLVSRISVELREKRGLTYSAYSYFVPMRHYGPYVLALQTRNEQAEEALKVLRETLKDFIATGPSEKELQLAKESIIGGFPLQIDSNSKKVQHLAMIGFYNLPLDYLEKFSSQVKAVTTAQIRAAFRRRVHLDKMITVMVGGTVKG
ncbi:peptidase M16-like zinc depedent peptidase [Candidatus Nitrosoglobus terrae]|uniref:Peptidase M16-like zinc depedent peptidase n=1 Tax=Candidatus Nitrosoglobus terrae TaxID=1630141 RepID=A0A1Q2SP77_9GAMM|nr:pitrilysin family protein [Candidatus Nitrosoglobus terrae]BAW80940.1 peptidase M16-like zinc depedent peptidase [Candidatus Nitrosoglobus terrae]